MRSHRSAFLTVVIVLYVIVTAFLGRVLADQVIATFNGFMRSAASGVFELAIAVMYVVMIVMNSIYVVKLWSADRSLRRWTDIMVLLGGGAAIVTFATFALPPVLQGTAGNMGVQGYVLLFGYLVLALGVFSMVWVLVRRHLAHLERNVSASFDRGLFNRSAQSPI